MIDPTTVNINYEPLLSMNHVLSKVVKSLLSGRRLVIAIILVVIAIPLSIVTAGEAILLLFVLYALYVGVLVGAYKNQVWVNFAEANRWSVDSETPQVELIPPSLQFGHSPRFSPVIKAQLGSVAADLFTYQCSTGEDRTQQIHRFTVARVDVGASLPHMVLLAKSAHADMRQDFANHEDLQLEGDFSKYFTLQIEKGQEIDALAVITPDVMQTLVTYENSEDIEIFAADLYFIMGSDKRDYMHAQQIITSVMELSGKIIEHVRLTNVPMTAQLQGTAQQSTTTSPVTPEVIVPNAPPGAQR